MTSTSFTCWMIWQPPGAAVLKVDLANTLKSANTIEGPTVYELEEAEAAETAWKAADEALTDYQSSKLQLK